VQEASDRTKLCLDINYYSDSKAYGLISTAMLMYKRVEISARSLKLPFMGLPNKFGTEL